MNSSRRLVNSLEGGPANGAERLNVIMRIAGPGDEVRAHKDDEVYEEDVWLGILYRSSRACSSLYTQGPRDGLCNVYTVPEEIGCTKLGRYLP